MTVYHDPPSEVLSMAYNKYHSRTITFQMAFNRNHAGTNRMGTGFTHFQGIRQQWARWESLRSDTEHIESLR